MRSSLNRLSTIGIAIGWTILHALALSGFGQERVPLFNGKDLTGWVLVNTPAETWSVQDGMLVCTGKPIGEIRTERMYQNFELEVEWRHMVPGGNAGIFVWADDITSRGVPFHRSIEVQVLENAYGNSDSHTTHGDIFPIHGATMEPLNGRKGGSRAFPTENRSKPSPEWNHYRIVAKDGQLSLAVNGKVVTQGKECNPRKGYICLESEGGVVHYRHLWIRELPDSPVAPDHVAIENRGFRSIYSGLDLRGWKTTLAGASAWKPSDWVLAFDGSVAVGESRLEFQEEPSQNGLVVDFRFLASSKQLHLTFPGIKEPLVIRAEQDPMFSEALEKSGEWNRLEVERKAGRLVYRVNGKAFAGPLADAAGKLMIASDGAVELANIYVR